MRRYYSILPAVAAAAMVSTSLASRPEADGALNDLPEPPAKPQAKQHGHAREIARRLRQQARLEAKRAKAGAA